MVRHHHAQDLPDRDRAALVDGQRLLGHRGQPVPAGLLLDRRLDLADDRLRLVVPAVDGQPARALRHVAADQQDEQPEQRTETESHPPADVLGQEVLVQEQQGQRCAGGGAQPVRAVDDQIDPAAQLLGHQLVDGRVDRRVLTADAGPGQEPAREEVDRGGGKCGEHGRDEIHAKRHHEQPAPAEALGEVAEEQGTQAGSENVHGGGGSDVRRGDLEPAALLREAVTQGTHDRDLESVQDPHGAQSDQNGYVPPGPGQPVKPGGDRAMDHTHGHHLTRDAKPRTGGSTPAGSWFTAQLVPARRLLNNFSVNNDTLEQVMARFA